MFNFILIGKYVVYISLFILFLGVFGEQEIVYLTFGIFISFASGILYAPLTNEILNCVGNHEQEMASSITVVVRLFASIIFVQGTSYLCNGLKISPLLIMFGSCSIILILLESMRYKK